MKSMVRTENPSPWFVPLDLRGRMWHNTTRMRRWIFFLAAIAVGGIIGLFYGWRINPVEYSNTVPAKLRQDYKSDYVLMVAEAFKDEDDMSLAVERLSFLGGMSPDSVVLEAINFAGQQGYRESDMALMNDLADELEFFRRVLETPTP